MKQQWQAYTLNKYGGIVLRSEYKDTPVQALKHLLERVGRTRPASYSVRECQEVEHFGALWIEHIAGMRRYDAKTPDKLNEILIEAFKQEKRA